MLALCSRPKLGFPIPAVQKNNEQCAQGAKYYPILLPPLVTKRSHLAVRLEDEHASSCKSDCHSTAFGISAGSTVGRGPPYCRLSPAVSPLLIQRSLWREAIARLGIIRRCGVRGCGSDCPCLGVALESARRWNSGRRCCVATWKSFGHRRRLSHIERVGNRGNTLKWHTRDKIALRLK
ncbi:hypothetical protein CYLTODRAFT_96509 [Cylindrobasidium torrendii FP15055 ss-10]|uniref:Uncharacterized protein n=1 Tax=Cylindrobasidium torrendii FP15055 ss-10 TaxID=1314674 RepID=A0A0D7BMH6_9AGAR|nr:hypothetical protein CYLTODRAFT_96509 [Cylindrobasidium torrendii FP15055 ss-10]